VRAAAATAACAVTRIGRIEAQAGTRVVDRNGHAVAAAFTSFDHFKQ
jgi:thiamine-monophosphate kinase